MKIARRNVHPRRKTARLKGWRYSRYVTPVYHVVCVVPRPSLNPRIKRVSRSPNGLWHTLYLESLARSY